MAPPLEPQGQHDAWQEPPREFVVQANVRGRDVSTCVNEARARLDLEVELPPGYHDTRDVMTSNATARLLDKRHSHDRGTEMPSPEAKTRRGVALTFVMTVVELAAARAAHSSSLALDTDGPAAGVS
ncbi:hypothetical protein WME76_03345 [Sorangium sp. So ce119]|uniref:hypothetical protein n=1 Tax=Sorangium sp. So ce119 TaxID=3133279 RepID=UPI003F5F5A30